MGFFNWLKRAIEPADNRYIAPDFAEAVRNIPDVVATIPNAPVRYQFRCVKDFFSKELKSQYVANGIYSVRQGNDRLDLFVKQWVREGKVRRGA